jgi:POT family proton-dependent oligopeptide transporter
MVRDRQPRGLYLLFFTELWERFGFYTLQTILILYMTKSLLMADERAYLLYGTFSSMLYLTPVIGGYLADKYLGSQRSIIVGGSLLMAGYLLCALPETWGFFLGLSVIIVANGLFKPNLLRLVGDLYGQGDERRNGYTVGITIGSLIPPLFTGWLVYSYGWHLGFVAAAMGMGLGLMTFILGRSRLRTAGALPAMSPLHDRGDASRFHAFFFLGIIGCIGAMMFLFHYPLEADILLAVALIAISAVVLWLLLKETPVQRNKMTACMILMLISVVFWALYSQTFTSLMLYADRHMDRQFLGFQIDAEFTRVFNPFFIIVLSPFLSRLWIFLGKKKGDPSTLTRFSFGILFLAFGFILPGIGGVCCGSGGETSSWWLVGSYFLQTIGELLLFPIGLAMIMTLRSKHLVGMMMGLWFLTQAAAFALGGGLATLASVPVKTSVHEALWIYDRAFFIYGGVGLTLAVVSFLLVPCLKRLIHGTEEPEKFHGIAMERC